MNKLTATLLLIFITSHFAVHAATINGELMPWHKVQIDFEGPEVTENDQINPFTDYRLDVRFSGPEGQMFQVPGFYAADGDAAETSAESGNTWRVNFCPNSVGEWTYTANFVTGANVAAKFNGGESAGFFDGEAGSFMVSENTNTDEKDFRNKGKLVYTGEHFLQFAGSKEYYIKAGANSPEVFLEYAEFDNTPSDRLYPDHIADWNEESPTWQGDKGKGIIGTVNYLSSIDINGYYFLSMNAYGDGKQAWPWIHQDSMYRYDCSKLDQWDIVFQHMNQMGVMVHMVMTETENESYFEINELGEAGGFADARKIYYREMIARYGYLPAITWNIGEENGWADNKAGEDYKIANTHQQRKDFCDYVRHLTYYNDHISIHNGPSWDDYIFPELIGHKSHTGPAFQWDFSNNIYAKILEYRTKSAESGHKWVMNMDEVYVNPETQNVDEWRTENVWATFMAGGAGIELYIGAGYDLRVQNFRLYEDHLKTMVRAADFIRENVPVIEMEPKIISDQWALVKQDELFVFYFKNAANISVDLPENQYKVLWYNPRNGGAPIFGTKKTIEGGTAVNIGTPPSEENSDWACLITKIDNNQSYLDINSSFIEKTVDKGEAAQVIADTIEVKNSDSITVEVSNAPWLTVSETDVNGTYLVELNEEANTLEIGEYLAVITFKSAELDPVSLNYQLTVQYNLGGNEFFYLDNNMAVIEVESAPLAEGWELANELEGFSGDGYCFYNGDINFTAGLEEFTNSYYFFVPKAGDYTIQIRNYIDNDDYTEDNDTWIRMDDDVWWKHFSHTNNTWNWDTQKDDGEHNFTDLEWYLEEGFHHFQVCARSPQFYLDKIHIFNSKAKDIEVEDSSWVESAKSDRTSPIITLSKNIYTYTKTQGRISFSTLKVNIGNAGIGELGALKATSNVDWVVPEINGSGNEQVLNIAFDDKAKELDQGDYSCSIVVSGDGVSDREVKIYITVKRKTGISSLENSNLKLKTNVVTSVIELLGIIESKADIKVYDMNGRLIKQGELKGSKNPKISVHELSNGAYILKLNSKEGNLTRRFVKI